MKISIAFLLLVLLFPVQNFAQPSEKLIMKKLSPDLLYELAIHKRQYDNLRKFAVKPRSEKSVYTKSTGKYSVIIKTNDNFSPENFDVKFNSVLPGYATAHLSLDEILNILENPSIKYVYFGETVYPTNEVANGLTGADLVKAGYINSTSYDGTDVIVLIVDTGIDWSLADFQESGTSRILYLWDQTLTVTGSEQTPEDRDPVNFAGLDYGVEYTRADINDEIDGSPAGFVREKDYNGHGTHVSGIAAGNGANSSGKYAGIASGADIVFVKPGDNSFPTSYLIDALTYAKKIADTESKPVVVNMSLGSQANAHDGTRDLDRAVDNFTSSGSGRAFCAAAGNDGDSPIHISGTAAASSSATVTVTVPTYTANAGTDNDYFYLDLWWSDSLEVDVTVTTPNGYTYTQTSNSQGTGTTADGYIFVFNYVDASYTNDDRRNYFKIYDGVETQPPAQGTWTITLSNNSSTTMIYHAWLFATSMNATLTSGNTDYTVASPGVANSALTVASYVGRWRWHTSDGNNYSYGTPDYSDDISVFSSIGPTRDGRQKPDLAAPGQALISCRSGDATVGSWEIIDSYYRKLQGTSMASPVATGCVALMLDYDPTLTASQIKSYLISSTTTDDYTGASLPDYHWGYGKINIFNAIGNISSSSTSTFNKLISYDTWSSSSYYSFGANVKIAVKFTPDSDGEITGAFFHTWTTVDITSPLYIEIWSDDGSGAPDAKLGSTVSYDYSKIAVYGWNYATLTGTGVSVSSGGDYHLVIYYTSGTTLTIATDNGSVDGNSSYDSGSGWTSYTSGDFRLRPVVSTSESSVPVELVSFDAFVKGNTIELNWQTATESNNFGFEIERTASGDVPSNWETIGFVEGGGNSNSPKSYSFTDSVNACGKYSYRLKQIDLDGAYKYSRTVEVEIVAPNKFELMQNYPNPFNPTTTISYSLPVTRGVETSRQGVTVSLQVFNSIGQKVATLVNKEQAPGNYTVQFDANDLPSGIYFYTLRAGKFVETKKMVLIK